MNKIFAFLLLICSLSAQAESPLKGTWQQKFPDGRTATLLCSENYLMLAEYHFIQKKYFRSAGGTYQLSKIGQKKVISFNKDFNTQDPMSAGTTIATLYTLANNVLSIPQGPLAGTWQKVVETGTSTLTGNWRLKAKEDTNFVMQTQLKGSLKTIKLLTKQYFHEVSFNIDTQQFFTSFGGTYSQKNKKYYEKINFNAMIPKQAGQSIEYDFLLNGKDWIHAGQSSKGERVNEVWEKIE